MKTINEKIKYIECILEDNNIEYIIPKAVMGDTVDEDLFSIEILILNNTHDVVALLDTRIKGHISVFKRIIIDNLVSQKFFNVLFKIEDQINTMWRYEEDE